jgi:hypothetical protein
MEKIILPHVWGLNTLDKPQEILKFRDFGIQGFGDWNLEFLEFQFLNSLIPSF